MATKKQHVDEGELRDVVGLTELMRIKEKELKMLSEKRTKAARRHQENGVTYEQLGHAMNLSGVAVYKILKGKEGRIRDRKAKERAEED